MNSEPQHFIWYDYETYGLDPKFDQIAQLAAVLTDDQLNIIEAPVNELVWPHLDYLPEINACCVHGIKPSLAKQKGISEFLLAKRLQQLFFQFPSTCIVGYNSLRFDDEFTRFLFFKNLFDPYGWHYQKNNTRWDVIDLVRMVYVYHPSILKWPLLDQSAPTFQLEKLTKINQIEHSHAHDALSDVYATIELAKHIKTLAPRLYHYYLKLRFKKNVSDYFKEYPKQPFLYTSGHLPNEYGCTSVWQPICLHPIVKDQLLTYDLRFDPTDFIQAIESCDHQALDQHLYSKNADLEKKGLKRWHLKSIQFNRSPAIVPLVKFDQHVQKRIALDEKTILDHQKKLVPLFDHLENLKDFFRQKHSQKTDWPDEACLYVYGLNSDDDADILKKRAQMSLSNLLEIQPNFKAAHLNRLWSRQRARLGLKLSADESKMWEDYLKRKASGSFGQISVQEYQKNLSNQDASKKDIADDLLLHSKFLSQYTI